MERFDGSSWTPVTSAGFSNFVEGNTVSLAVAYGTPYVAYRDGDNGFRATVEVSTSLAPRTTRMSPQDGAWVNDQVVVISARFDRPMDLSTVQNTANFQVSDANGKVQVDNISWFPGTLTAVFTVPRVALAGEVTVTLTDDMQDRNGIALPERQWSFWVQ